jgi:hypothetical protein
MSYLFYIAGEELLVNEDLVCYHWTEEDNNAMPQGRTAEDERYYCEDVLGYTFSKGDYLNYPNCGACWCCRPEGINFIVFSLVYVITN